MEKLMSILTLLALLAAEPVAAASLEQTGARRWDQTSTAQIAGRYKEGDFVPDQSFQQVLEMLQDQALSAHDSTEAPILEGEDDAINELMYLIEVGEMKKLRDPVNQPKRCTICLDEYGEEDVTYLPCGHKFHKDCIIEWAAQSTGKGDFKCPICRLQVGTMLSEAQ